MFLRILFWQGSCFISSFSLILFRLYSFNFGQQTSCAARCFILLWQSWFFKFILANVQHSDTHSHTHTLTHLYAKRCSQYTAQVNTRNGLDGGGVGSIAIRSFPSLQRWCGGVVELCVYVSLGFTFFCILFFVLTMLCECQAYRPPYLYLYSSPFVSCCWRQRRWCRLGDWDRDCCCGQQSSRSFIFLVTTKFSGFVTCCCCWVPWAICVSVCVCVCRGLCYAILYSSYSFYRNFLI